MDQPTDTATERRPLRERIAQRMSRRRSPTSEQSSTDSASSSSFTPAPASVSAPGAGANASSAAASANAKSANGKDPTLGTSSGGKGGGSASTDLNSDATFECNVCFDVPRDPVVTPCGHLYCWPCLYRWMRLHADSPQCPVCKAGLDKRTVIPIYGRGRSQADDPRSRSVHATPPGGNGTTVVEDEDEDGNGARRANHVNHDADVPPRPQGHRAPPLRRPLHATTTFGVHHTFGINANADNYENFAFSTFGLFPSLFGLQVAYPHINEQPRDDGRDANHEEGTSELVGKVFLLLAVFIVIIITTF